MFCLITSTLYEYSLLSGFGGWFNKNGFLEVHKQINMYTPLRYTKEH